MSPEVRSAAARLERERGLRFDGAGLRRLERALAAAAADRGVALARHAEEVVADPALLGDLIDRVTVQETSWFRDAPAFAALEQALLPAAIRTARAEGRPVRIWSAGCANGQEAWSLAILAAEQGAEATVLATDISRPALRRAEAGVYTDRELRGLTARRRDAFLEPAAPGTWRVRDALRPSVRFAGLDLVADAPPLPGHGVDLVLCRYVLIYLAPEASARVLDRIAGLLTPAGRLLVGAAESLWHLTDRFGVEAFDDAFAYRPAAAAPLPTRRGDGSPRAGDAPEGAGRDPRPLLGGRAAPAPPPSPPRGEQPLPERDGLLAAGEAAMAAGDLPGAVAAFRGAAYLDPDAAVAHVRLGLALEQQGDPGAHRAFRAAWSAIDRTGLDGLPHDLGGWRAEELVRLVGMKLGAIR